MTLFWLAAGLLLLIALAYLLLPIVRGRRAQTEEDRTALNVSLYQERLAELQAQYDAGTLSAEQLEAGKAEAGRELLEDTGVEERLQLVREITRAIATSEEIDLQHHITGRGHRLRLQCRHTPRLVHLFGKGMNVKYSPLDFQFPGRPMKQAKQPATGLREEEGFKRHEMSFRRPAWCRRNRRAFRR